MKRIINLILSALVILLIPFSSASGQEKKSEQKIKIVIDDGSGSKVILDTLVKDSNLSDSIRLKDGKVVIIRHSDSENAMRYHGGKKYIVTTITPDEKDTENDENSHAEKVIVIKNGNAIEKDDGETFEYTVKTDCRRPDSERTKYVIDKDGIKVTVEGNDYDKVKKLVREIEEELEINHKETQDSKAVKEDLNKGVKK